MVSPLLIRLAEEIELVCWTLDRSCNPKTIALVLQLPLPSRYNLLPPTKPSPALSLKLAFLFQVNSLPSGGFSSTLDLVAGRRLARQQSLILCAGAIKLNVVEAAGLLMNAAHFSTSSSGGVTFFQDSTQLSPGVKLSTRNITYISLLPFISLIRYMCPTLTIADCR